MNIEIRNNDTLAIYTMTNATHKFSYSKHTFLIVIVFLSTLLDNIFAQSFSAKINWGEPQKMEEYTFSIPTIENNDPENGIPHYTFQEKIKSGTYQFNLRDIQTESAPSIDRTALQQLKAEIPTSPQITFSARKSRADLYAIASVFPYYMNDGELVRIISFSFEATRTGNDNVAIQKDYVANSVLNSGDWYKISVAEDGIYKIDKAFLKSCGIDTVNLIPQSINIYGNASGRLSERNSDLFYDDLAKNPIQVIGESDGVFNDDDYILFYGAGPNRWDYTPSSGFERNQHIYSTVNCYFIHISSTDLPLRIATVASSSNPTTHTVSDYDYFDIREEERYNLVKGGQRWYGNLFDGELSQPVSFSIPDIVSSTPLNVQYAMASNATSSGNTFTFNLNGSTIHTQAISSSGSDFSRSAGTFSINSPSSSIPFILTLNRVNPSVKGYLDYIEVSGRRNLRMLGSQFQFRDTASVGAGNVGDFILTGITGNLSIWDISNRRNPFQISGTTVGSQVSFKAATDTLRQFIAFYNSTFLTPLFVSAVANQDLHALGQIENIIVTPPSFLLQANRLAALHEAQGTSTHVVTTTEIYNEYSSGVTDATAIRRFVKMFYERALGDPNLQPKYLLLFGDGTYDPKNRLGGNNYFVPTYQFLNSENHINALVSDDYYGFMDNSESSAAVDMMDVAVGRLLISSGEHADQQVNKIEHYIKNGATSFYSGSSNDCCTGGNAGSFGDWRLNYSIIADDEEGAYFTKIDAEPTIDTTQKLYPEMNYDKIYTDAYVQVSTAGGQRYPDVNQAITDRVERGSLVINYIGHGGEVGAAHERIITIPQIQSWTNINRLNLFVTATCEFTRYDDPSRVSAGEWVTLNPTGGGIALMTTTRAVYFGVNTSTIKNLYAHLFERDVNNNPLAFGEIMRLTKNGVGATDNKRSFTLIGDPALRIALPKWRIVTDSINGFDPNLVQDTIRALSKLKVKGHVEDYSGNPLTTFNGILSPTIFDKEKVNQTLQNDAASTLQIFKTQDNALYKGKASVVNGNFTFECVVPKDINYAFGKGKISYYADDKLIDADGYDTNFVVGGINTNAVADVQGPTISIYLNDTKFVNGGITSQQPVLIVDCFDENGINTVGNGVGHDLVAILDGNTSEPIILNNFYSGKLDSYQAGQVQYTFKSLSPGNHILDVKIWDVNNNSSISRVEFMVVEDANVELAHVLNYPNPFTTRTTFFYEHNQSCSELETQIQIYTVSGRLVRTINQLVATSGFRTEGIDWDGTDEYGDQLAKGVYVYRLSVELPDGGRADKLEKLVLLK